MRVGLGPLHQVAGHDGHVVGQAQQRQRGARGVSGPAGRDRERHLTLVQVREQLAGAGQRDHGLVPAQVGLRVELTQPPGQLFVQADPGLTTERVAGLFGAAQFFGESMITAAISPGSSSNGSLRKSALGERRSGFPGRFPGSRRCRLVRR